MGTKEKYKALVDRLDKGTEMQACEDWLIFLFFGASIFSFSMRAQEIWPLCCHDWITSKLL